MGEKVLFVCLTLENCDKRDGFKLDELFKDYKTIWTVLYRQNLSKVKLFKRKISVIYHLRLWIFDWYVIFESYILWNLENNSQEAGIILLS